MTTASTSRRAPTRAATVAAGLVVLAALVAPAAAARAQGMAAFGAAKGAAKNAAAATNAHTAAMTSPDGGSGAQRSANKPAAAQPVAAQPAAAKSVAAKSVAAKPAPAPRYAAGAGAPGAASRSSSSVAVTERGAATEMTFFRETFEYGGRGRRDPFVSLMANGELRPLLSDLKLVTVLYDPTGRNSVAIMRDLSTKDQYRVKVGQTLGRMRVSQIQPRQVVFALDEFGYGRQEVLGLTDSTTARKQ